MVWGAMTADGTLALHRIHGTVKSANYVDILQEHVLPFFIHHPGWTYQQDNAPAHKSRLTMNWFADNGITVMVWPPNSPDLNPIEHVGSAVKRQLDSTVVHGFEELWQASSAIFANMDMEFIRHLYSSMPSRCAEVIKNRGGHTHY